MIQQPGNGKGSAPTTTASRYRELLQDDPRLALELAIAESERAKSRIAETRSVQLDAKGRFIVRSLDGLLQLGGILANSQMVPERFAGKQNDCAIGAHMAIQLGMHPITVLQSMYIVYGNPGFDAKFAIALVTVRGGIDNIIQYEHEGEGDSRRCRAWVRLKGQPEKVYGPWVTAAMVKAEKWDQPRGEKKMVPKWVTMPDLMYEYRSATFLMRTRFPHLLMGLKTVDELEDIHGVNVDEVAGVVEQMSPDEIRVRTTPAVAAPPITLPQPPAEPKTEQPPAETTTTSPPETKPETAPVEKSETPPVGAPESATPDSREAVYEEWVAKLKMVRTVNGVESLTKQIHEGRAAMTGDQYEALLELSDSRRFELDRKSGKQRTF